MEVSTFRGTGESTSSKMSDFEISPLVRQVFRDEAPVTMVRCLFAAKKTPAVDQLFGDPVLDFPLRDEVQEPASVGGPVAVVFAVCIKELFAGRKDGQVQIVDAAQGLEKEAKIIPLGKAG